MDEEKMFTYNITECKVIYVQIDDTHAISVGFELFRNGVDENGDPSKTLEGVFRLGFDLGTKKPEVIAALDKFCETREKDLETSAKDAELNERLDEADALREELLNSN